MLQLRMTLVIDTLNASEILKKAGFKSSQAKALVKALSPTTDDMISKAELDSAINKLKSELIVWMVGLHIASISLIVALIG